MGCGIPPLNSAADDAVHVLLATESVIEAASGKPCAKYIWEGLICHCSETRENTSKPNSQARNTNIV